MLWDLSVSGCVCGIASGFAYTKWSVVPFGSDLLLLHSQKLCGSFRMHAREMQFYIGN